MPQTRWNRKECLPLWSNKVSWLAGFLPNARTAGAPRSGDEVEQVQKLREVQGYTFYHMQDNEVAAETGALCLTYGALTGNEEDSVAIGTPS